MLYDPFLRKEVFEDKPWYEEFLIFHAIGVCQVPDEYVLEVRIALAQFLFATRIFMGKEPGSTFVSGNGAIEINDMATYIQSLQEGE